MHNLHTNNITDKRAIFTLGHNILLLFSDGKKCLSSSVFLVPVGTYNTTRYKGKAATKITADTPSSYTLVYHCQ